MTKYAIAIAAKIYLSRTTSRYDLFFIDKDPNWVLTSLQSSLRPKNFENPCAAGGQRRGQLTPAEYVRAISAALPVRFIPTSGGEAMYIPLFIYIPPKVFPWVVEGVYLKKGGLPASPPDPGTRTLRHCSSALL